MSDGEIFSRLGMTPGLNAAADARKGTLAILLLDRRTQQTVWSSAIQLASDARRRGGPQPAQPAARRSAASGALPAR